MNKCRAPELPFSRLYGFPQQFEYTEVMDLAELVYGICMKASEL